MKEHILKHISGEPDFSQAEPILINEFLPNSSDFHPEVECRALYSDEGFHLLYTVKDRFVVCRATKYQDIVCRDSCVEFFAHPQETPDYINMEFSANGIMLAHHITDCHRGEDRVIAGFTPLGPEVNELVRRETSLHGVIDPEITEPVTWTLRAFIPFSIYAKTFHCGIPKAGDVWSVNFYTCADASSHPRWAAWNPVPEWNFHLPNHFGIIRFGE